MLNNNVDKQMIESYLKGKDVLRLKLAAACFVSIHGAPMAGIKTKAVLMHPVLSFTDQEVMLQASNFIEGVLAALLKVLPLQDLEQILKDQDEHLSFVHGLR